MSSPTDESWEVEVRGGDGKPKGGPLLWVVDDRGNNVAFVEGPASRSYLVAAAPDLLEALEYLLDRMGQQDGTLDHVRDRDPVHVAEQAIAKARQVGDSPQRGTFSRLRLP